MVIVLMGYMGSGKSTIGRHLASILNYDFIDLDDYIETKEEQSITSIFQSKGEIYFRKLETKYLQELLSSEDNVVLALGGGTPCYSNNMELILTTNNAKSVYLKLSITALVERLKSEKQNRPLISHLNSDEALLEFIGKHLFERSQYYSQSNYTINTEGKSIKDITELILMHLI